MVRCEARPRPLVMSLAPSTGNCFGEEGIELLRGSLEAKGLADALASLSDDEGLEDDDEDDQSDDREESEVIKPEDIRNGAGEENTVEAVSSL